jgi:hypothetical protein
MERTIMPEIGEQMRKAYHWVPAATPFLYLIMDNTGGHATHDCIEKYTAMLKDDHNIHVIHQVPRGPELNLLDLGVLILVQSFIEKMHQPRPQN